MRDDAAERTTGDDPDVQRSEEDAHGPAHAVAGDHLQQVAVQRGEDQGRACSTRSAKHHDEGKARGQPGQDRRHPHDDHPGHRTEALAEPVDERTDHRIGDQAHEGEGGDEEARRVVADSEGPGVQRQDGCDHPEAQHDHEDDEDDDPHGRVRDDQSEVDLLGFRRGASHTDGSGLSRTSATLLAFAR
jgi:hypothetical protein